MSTTETSCQSCGMPMAMDANGGGTEADGSRSTAYCSHCYEGGAFTLPDLTVDQMQERVRAKLNELNMPPHIVSGAVSEIPSLRRWAG